MKEKQAIIGIDCGANGAIAVYSEGKVVCHRMPKDVHSLAAILSTHKDNQIIFIERVSGWVSDQYIAGKAFGIAKLVKNYNMTINVVAMLNQPWTDITAQTWQKAYKITQKETKQQRKLRYKKTAQMYYPDTKVSLWNADALLILTYARTMTKLINNLKTK